MALPESRPETRLKPPAPFGGSSPLAACLSGHSAWATFAVSTLLGLWLLRNFIFGEWLYLFKDVADDSISLFYPRFFHVAEYLRSEGLPGWSFSQGLGQDIRPFSLGDPFTWILYASGAARVAHTVAYMELSKFVVAGMLFGAYLRTAGCLPFTATVGAVLYAYCGFMVVGSGWTLFSTYGVLFALILLAFESYLAHGRRWLFPIAVAAVAAVNPASLAPFGFGGLIYAGFRMAEVGNTGIRRAARSFGELALLAVLGLLMSAWFWVGTAWNMLQSPRGSGDASHFPAFFAHRVFDLGDGAQIATAIARTFSSDLLGTGDDFQGWFNYFEAPLFYCGSAALFLFALSFSLPDRRRRRLRLAFACIAFLPVLLPFLRYAIWCFSGNYYRQYSLVVVLALLYPALRTFDRLLRGWRPSAPQVALASAVWMPPLLGLALYADGIDRLQAAAIALLLAAYASLVTLACRSRWRTTAFALFALLVCVEAAWFGHRSLADRPVLAKRELTESVGYNDHSIDAIRHARSLHPDFHRLAKNFGSAPTAIRSRNDSKVQGYFGTTSYYSFNQVHYIRFLAALGFLDPTVETETRWTDGMHGAPGTEGLMSVRYRLIRGHPSERSNPTQRFIGRFGDIDLYENRLFVPFGFTYDRAIDRDDFYELEPTRRRLALQRGAVVDRSRSSSEFDWLGELDPEEANRAYPDYGIEAALHDVALLSEDVLELQSFSHNGLRGRIETDRPKLLFFSIPFDAGWRAEVDGVPARLHRVNVGFLGLPLPAGTHEVALRFVPAYGRASAAASLLGLTLYGLGLRRWRNRGTVPHELASGS